MGLEFLLIAVGILIGLAVLDLMVGVSNDAANFLNSSLGSRVAPRHVIMMIASLGIMTGVIFSSGMMEVARKGIFHPQLFTMPELMTIFLAVMLTDVILLDLFNTFGFPTSTTVSIVFELLGAAVMVALLKVLANGENLADVQQYINSGRAMVIISGILASVAVSFICGAIVQFLSRTLFTFDYEPRLRRFGAIWGGIAMASITYFILVKGAKGAAFATPEMLEWIKVNTWPILLVMAAVSAVLLQLLLLRRINILKPIVLMGTFALALAFAANDLMNFVGVPLAGLQSYQAAVATSDPLNATMEALSGKLRSESYMLLIAGVVMVITLWLSRKARTVSEMEVNLARQEEEGHERFDSSFLSRGIVKMMLSLADGVASAVPGPVRSFVGRRFDRSSHAESTDAEQRPSFDLLRAGVNLMVASAVVSYATSQKLPLSTTYVTFMVAMGTSFADRAWGRESAVFRVTGVLSVVGGWFMTALMAFSFAALAALFMFKAGAWGVGTLVLLAGGFVWRTHHTHSSRVKDRKDDAIFNLKKISDAESSISTTFEHMGILVQEIRLSLSRSLDALFTQNADQLRAERPRCKKFQSWANIIIANVFKVMRLEQEGGAEISFKYAQTIRRVQKLVDGHRDIVMRSHDHVSNLHAGLLDEQVEELREVGHLLNEILLKVETMLSQAQPIDRGTVLEYDLKLRELAERLNEGQTKRIQGHESKTRLTILYYAIVGNAMMLSKQNVKLLEIFEEAFSGQWNGGDFDLD